MKHPAFVIPFENEIKSIRFPGHRSLCFVCVFAGAAVRFWISLNASVTTPILIRLNTSFPILLVADYGAPKLILIRLFDTFPFVAASLPAIRLHPIPMSLSFSHSFQPIAFDIISMYISIFFFKFRFFIRISIQNFWSIPHNNWNRTSFFLFTTYCDLKRASEWERDGEFVCAACDHVCHVFACNPLMFNNNFEDLEKTRHTIQWDCLKH